MRNPLYQEGSGGGGTANEGGEGGDGGEPSTGPNPATVGAPDTDAVGSTGADESADGVESGTTGTTTGLQPNWIFQDATGPGEFDAGTSVEIAWTQDRLELGDSHATGVFHSRVYDAGDTGVWETLAWNPSAPYRRPLPPFDAPETDYKSGNIDTGELRLLLPFDGLDVAAQTTTPDLSGWANHAVAQQDGGPFAMVPGVFGGAIHNPSPVDVTAPSSFFEIEDVAAVSPGTSDFTWSVWFRTDSCPTDNVAASLDVPGSDPLGAPSVWLECGCNGVMSYGVRDDGIGPADCLESIPVADAQWHHLALVKEGQAMVTAYFDGAPADFSTESIPGDLDPADGVRMTVAGTPDPAFSGYGDIDEFAIFHRALLAEEIASLWERGAADLGVRVRACDEPTCAGVPFVGPDGTGMSSFRDQRAELHPWESHALPPGLVGRFVQYEVRMAVWPGGRPPSLDFVELRGAPN